jgi:tetratricopeptide (TPR) repeat protein
MAALLLVLAGPAFPLRADDDAALRQRVLALNDVTGEKPLDGQLRILMADPAGTKKLLAAAKSMAKEKNSPLTYTAQFLLARAAHELKDFDTARILYEASVRDAAKLQSVQKVTLSLRGLIALFYENGKYEECSRICQQFLEVPGDPSVERMKPAVIEVMIQAIAKQGKHDEALKLVDRLVKAEKDEGWWALTLRGWVQREKGDFDEAAKTYEEVLKRIDKDASLQKPEKERYTDRHRYILSNVYVDLNRIDKASEMLQGLLEHKPDDPTFNNDLGYIWADHDMKLDEAEKLIRKALDLDRKERKKDPDLQPDEDHDNPAYLDSLGWVLYKKKQYKEAKRWLLEATKDKDAQDLEIYDHLGDVHKALGEDADALAAWKKAVQLAKPVKRDQKKKTEIEQKIKAAGEKPE